ncbi:carbohydrate-binding module family 13 protein [Irpex lacteus]|nr:carbohydrate-binding module family 13 protein [Irpex lacteus]
MSRPDSGSVYRFRNERTGKVLTLSDDNKSCTGFDWYGGKNQKWRLERHEGDNHWAIQNVVTGGYLSINQDPGNGTPVEVTSNLTTWAIKEDELDLSVFRFFYGDTKYNLQLADHGRVAPATLWAKWTAMFLSYEMKIRLTRCTDSV